MNKLLLVPVIAIFMLASCSEEPELDDLPVIEGWIDSDGHPVVLFTTSLTPDNDGGELVDKMIRWGKITISDGEHEAVLTGGSAAGYFPPYRYYSTALVGEPGKTYTLNADYRSMHATATCTMPQPTKIERFTLEPFGDADTLRSVTMHFMSPADVPAYYYVTIRDIEQTKVSLPALMGCKAVYKPNEAVSLPVFNTKQTHAGEKFVAQLQVGVTYAITLNRVTKEVFDFWQAYDDALLFGGNILVGQAASLPSNVNGGLGVFSARGTDTKLLKVE